MEMGGNAVVGAGGHQPVGGKGNGGGGGGGGRRWCGGVTEGKKGRLPGRGTSIEYK